MTDTDLRVTLSSEPLTRLLLSPLTNRAVREQQQTAAYVIASALADGWTPTPSYVEQFRVADVAYTERHFHGIHIEAVSA